MGIVRVDDVMNALAAACRSVAGLRVSAWPGTQATPPSAMVLFPEVIEPDVTMSRGTDAMTVPVLVAFGAPMTRQTVKMVADYTSGAGSKSLIKAINDWSAPAFDFATVEKVEFGVHTIAGVDYIAAQLSVRVIGSGRV